MNISTFDATVRLYTSSPVVSKLLYSVFFMRRYSILSLRELVFLVNQKLVDQKTSRLRTTDITFHHPVKEIGERMTKLLEEMEVLGKSNAENAAYFYCNFVQIRPFASHNRDTAEVIVSYLLKENYPIPLEKNINFLSEEKTLEAINRSVEDFKIKLAHL